MAVGEALRQRPDLATDVVIETKVRDVATSTTPPPIAAQRRDQPKRLGLDFLHVVYIHDPAADVLNQVMAPDGALAALRQYQSQGVIGHVGIALNNPWDNAPYVETGEFEAAVVPDAFSLISQVARERIFPAAERFGMGVVVATPLERGLLATGTRALRPEDHINRCSIRRVLHHVARLEDVCSSHHVACWRRRFSTWSAIHWSRRRFPVPQPDQPSASVDAMLEPIPEAFWDEIEPLVRDFKVAVPPR